jgi:hypothetical protein
MNSHAMKTCALAVAGTVAFVGSAKAQRRTPSPTPQSLQQRYGVQGTYDGTSLHPAGHRSAAVPVTMDDGRTGEFVIPSDRRDAHPVYYRDDATGDVHPVRMDPRATRRQMVQRPRALRYESEPQHSNKSSWEKDALIVGGGAVGGALIGAAAGERRALAWARPLAALGALFTTCCRRRSDKPAGAGVSGAGVGLVSH